jgi:signal transduction histidine kinase
LIELLLPAQWDAMYATHLAEAAPRPATGGRTQELWGRHRDGHTFPVEASLSAFSISGRSAVVAHMIDISERRQAAERLAQELADRDALAIHNAQLFDQVRVGRERLQSLSSQLVHAQEEERRHLARELHDEIGQSLTAVHLNLQMLISTADAASAAARLEDSSALIEHALQQVRSLSLDLRPSLLDDLGLVPTLRWLLKRQVARAGFMARLVAESAEGRYLPDMETTCYRVVQEALNNAIRHARARNVVVTLEHRSTVLHLAIHDDGVGFDVASARRRAEQGQSLGLLSMRERVEIAGGRMAIESAPGQGTTIEAWLPLEQPRPGSAIERRGRPR